MSTFDPLRFYCAISEVQYLKAEAEIRQKGRQVSQLPVTLILSDGSVPPAQEKFVFIDRAVDVKTGAAKTWQFGLAVTVPLFTGGRLRGNLKLAQARFEESLARYQQAVQNAFREVSDGLIAYQRTREFRAKQEERTQANCDATALANVRYEGGVTSYLEVLYNEKELFSAELSLAQARRHELLSVIQLYRALGGGWTEPAPQYQASSNQAAN